MSKPKKGRLVAVTIITHEDVDESGAVVGIEEYRFIYYPDQIGDVLLAGVRFLSNKDLSFNGQDMVNLWAAAREACKMVKGES